MNNQPADRMRMAREAEQLAAEYLITKGYAIKERNWRPKPAPYEIDIIAQKGDVMAFVEVKARSTADPTSAVESVDYKKQRFISRAADIYLRQQPHLYYYRFDIIAVTTKDSAQRITHIEDAFMPPLGGVRK